MSFPDNFISYDNDFIVKEEKLSFHDDFTDMSPHSDEIPLFSMPFPQTLQNLNSFGDQPLLLESISFPAAAPIRKKSQPFDIIRPSQDTIRKASEDSLRVKVECEDKQVFRTKRIMKREKAKQRFKVKQEASSPALSSTTYNKYIPEGFDNPDLDDKTKRKMIQMIRNRISAQSSRDRKKAYMSQLEDVKAMLLEENNKLTQGNDLLKEQLKNLENTSKQLQSENFALKQNAGKTCYKCNQNCGRSNGKEDCSSDAFSRMLNSLTGIDMKELPEGNNSYSRKTLMLTTFISVMMIMNLSQQGNTLTLDGREKVTSKGFSEFERKVLQEVAVAANLQGDEEGGFNEQSLLECIKPFLNEGMKEMKQEAQSQSGSEISGSQPGFVKLEDTGMKSPANELEYLATFLPQKKSNQMEEEPGLFNTKKSQSSTISSPNSSEFGNSDDRMQIEEPEKQQKTPFSLQSLFQMANVAADSFSENLAGNNLVSSLMKAFGNGRLGFN